MLSADRAKDLSGKDNVLHRIFYHIEKAAVKGSETVDVYGTFDQTIIDSLNALGYVTSHSDNAFRIGWETPARYKIWDYYKDCTSHNDPSGIDFVKDLDIRLHKEDYLTNSANIQAGQYLGELNKQILYANFDGTTYTIPIVQIEWVYTRDVTTELAISRTESIKWFLDDGTLGSLTKSRTKYYSSAQQKRVENSRRRSNQVGNASEAALIKRVGWGADLNTAYIEGQVYFKTLVDEIVSFENGMPQPLIDKITADTTPTWLDDQDPVTPVETVRDFILAELSF